MDDFDYLNGTLPEWLSMFSGNSRTVMSLIEEEYLPRFEAAIWRKAHENA